MTPISLNKIKPWYEGVLSIFYPQLCFACNRNLNHAEEFLCKKCIVHLPRTQFENQIDNPVAQMFWGRVSIAFASSLFYYRKGEVIQEIIHRLKYRRNLHAGLFLGRLAARMVKESNLFPFPDLIVPVPLHKRKMRMRGYNQSELLARGMSEVLGAPYDAEVALRQVYGESQTQKSRYERWENVDEAFICGEISTDIRNILLVDDVVTTGATIEACASALQKASDAKISVVTIGYAAR
ncbi:ComF family protein [Alkalitalea saponilacus]|uniref:ComF family protein n=1 Tax=Alkalitalea saponilacus TaxID=889453 RepID=A0A1T5A5B7_9BACT|nr:ComF family protein [Alkalitalea saponilacus]ASB48843.1 amidophosphoribosyltransferase [Alkalitalea saponilacus]SKB30164.1 comF family protein [Alkalitalea saponilacus]